MKKHPKLVQADKRGQIVIPKEVRRELGIDESTGFFVYVIPGEGILLKQVEPENLAESNIVEELKADAHKIGVKKENVEKAEEDYKQSKGGLEEI